MKKIHNLAALAIALCLSAGLCGCQRYLPVGDMSGDSSVVLPGADSEQDDEPDKEPEVDPPRDEPDPDLDGDDPADDAPQGGDNEDDSPDDAPQGGDDEGDSDDEPDISDPDDGEEGNVPELPPVGDDDEPDGDDGGASSGGDLPEQPPEEQPEDPVPPQEEQPDGDDQEDDDDEGVIIVPSDPSQDVEVSAGGYDFSDCALSTISAGYSLVSGSVSAGSELQIKDYKNDKFSKYALLTSNSSVLINVGGSAVVTICAANLGIFAGKLTVSGGSFSVTYRLENSPNAQGFRNGYFTFECPLAAGSYTLTSSGNVGLLYIAVA